ncbi:MAG: hypothetical protein P8Y04_12950, partial [Desulfobulbaceae bacterium]
DEPTNHLDLESITALNNSLIYFSEVILFTSHDQKFVSTLANRIVEITADGIIDVMMSFDEYLEMKEAGPNGVKALPLEDEYIKRQAA